MWNVKVYIISDEENAFLRAPNIIKIFIKNYKYFK